MSDCPTCKSDAEAQRIHEIEVRAGARGYVAGWNDAVHAAARVLSGFSDKLGDGDNPLFDSAFDEILALKRNKP